MGYNPGPAAHMPHQGYPPGYTPYPNEYAQANVYHYPAGPYFRNPPPAYHSSGGGKAFVRGFIMCLCILFSAFFVATLVMALALHPQLPLYTVNSLSVLNFNTTSTLAGDWNASFMIQNINDKLTGEFSGFKADLLHKNDVVGVSFVPDFVLDKKQVKHVDVKPSSTGTSFPEWNLGDLGKEQATGSITFTMRISSMVAFKSSSMSTRGSLVLALCDGLKVVFQNNTGTGALENGGSPILCQLYM